MAEGSAASNQAGPWARPAPSAPATVSLRKARLGRAWVFIFVLSAWRSRLRSGAARDRRGVRLGLGLLPFLTRYALFLVEMDECALLVAHDDIRQAIAVDVAGH